MSRALAGKDFLRSGKMYGGSPDPKLKTLDELNGEWMKNKAYDELKTMADQLAEVLEFFSKMSSDPNILKAANLGWDIGSLARIAVAQYREWKASK